MLYWNRISIAACVATLCLSGSLHAFYPVDGWWWNPNESGRGFNIEMQDDEMFIAAFHYTPGGESVWWVANGRFNDATGQMNGTFIELENGQCPGCPYTGGPEVISGAGSPVTINFSTATTATLHWNGESIPIQRQYWRFALDQPNLFLFGEFHFTTGALGIYFGDRIYFDGTTTDSNNNEFLTGRVREGSSQRIAVARFDAGTGLFAILLDSSSSYYRFFAFDMTKDRMEGQSWVYQKGDSISGPGLPFIGHRVASRSFVQSGIGPHTNARQHTDAFSSDHTERDRQMIELQQVLAGRNGPSGTDAAKIGLNDSQSHELGKLHQSIEQAHAILQGNRNSR